MLDREAKNAFVTETLLRASIEGRNVHFIAASREQAEREFQTALKAVREGAGMRVEPCSIQPRRWQD